MATNSLTDIEFVQSALEQINWQDNIIVLALFALGGVFTITSPYFLVAENLINILRQTAIVSILGVGMTFAIISAEIDISIGGITAISAMLAAVTLSTGYPWYLGVAVCLGIGLGFGLLNGLITVRVGIPSFLVTLGMLGVTSGLALIVTNTQPVRVQTAGLFTVFSGQIGPIPIIVVWAVAIVAGGHFILSRTRFGRHVYATGDDTQAARYTGIDTDRIKILTLALSGLAAGIAGVLLMARLSVARPTMGDGLMLPTIAAVILGGTSLFGGRGWIPGTVLGAILMSTIDNGLVLNGFGSSFQEFIRGMVIIIAVAFRKQEGEGWISG